MQVSASPTPSIPLAPPEPDGALPIEDVTPDSLLSFLSIRLDQLDDGIARDIGDIESQGQDSVAISKRRELLDAIGSAIRLHTSNPKKTMALQNLKVMWDGEEKFANHAIKDAGLSSSLTFSNPNSLGDPTEKSHVTLENIEAASSMLEKQQKRLTSDNDLRMLRLQDMMNRRSQVIQMVSSFMRSIQDAQRAIVGNMR